MDMAISPPLWWYFCRMLQNDCTVLLSNHCKRPRPRAIPTKLLYFNLNSCWILQLVTSSRQLTLHALFIVVKYLQILLFNQRVYSYFAKQAILSLLSKSLLAHELLEQIQLTSNLSISRVFFCDRCKFYLRNSGIFLLCRLNYRHSIDHRWMFRSRPSMLPNIPLPSLLSTRTNDNQRWRFFYKRR